ncbi:LOW QUALITY PROTEIN: hypothetical protein V2J09_020332 [Rumex salicifolius]
MHPPTVTYLRRTPSGCYVSNTRDDKSSKDDLESEPSNEFVDYMVHISNNESEPDTSQPHTTGAKQSLSRMGREFDHNRWLFESKATYGYGNAIESNGSRRFGDDESSEDDVVNETVDKPWRPLTRMLKIPARVISPYRILILIRLIVLCLFLMWRVKNPNHDADWLWLMSVICELWFAFSWVLDQLPKLNPCRYNSGDVEASKRRAFRRRNESEWCLRRLHRGRPSPPDARIPPRPQKKAGAMIALVRASAIMSNGPFILNLDCDHYIYNSQAIRQGISLSGSKASTPPIDTLTIILCSSMSYACTRQGPVYVGTGCLFRRMALYGFDPPCPEQHSSWFDCCLPRRKEEVVNSSNYDETRPFRMGDEDEYIEGANLSVLPKRFGNSRLLLDSIPIGRVPRNGRPPDALTSPREILDESVVVEAINTISVDKTEWGGWIGWIFGSVTEDVVTSYRMQNRGWRSIYYVTNQDAFRGTAPINLTDRLHQDLSRSSSRETMRCFASRTSMSGSTRSPRFSLSSNASSPPSRSSRFIAESLDVAFLVYLLLISVTLCLLATLEINWAHITLAEWWRNEQSWLGGVTSHLVAVVQGLLKVMAGIEISFTLTSKLSGDENEDEYYELYLVKWTSLMIPPLVIVMVNLLAMAVGVSRTLYNTVPRWSALLGGEFFSLWALLHLYSFAKGLMGRRGRTLTIVFIWAGLIAVTISLLWVAIKSPSGSSDIGGSFTFP